MTDDKQPMQADGGTGARADKVGQPEASGAGQSGGGAYPDQAKRKPGSQDSFMGHGGQSEIACHGEGQLGDGSIPGEGNRNAPTR